MIRYGLILSVVGTFLCVTAETTSLLPNKTCELKNTTANEADIKPLSDALENTNEQNIIDLKNTTESQFSIETSDVERLQNENLENLEDASKVQSPQMPNEVGDTENTHVAENVNKKSNSNANNIEDFLNMKDLVNEELSSASLNKTYVENDQNTSDAQNIHLNTDIESEAQNGSDENNAEITHESKQESSQKANNVQNAPGTGYKGKPESDGMISEKSRRRRNLQNPADGNDLQKESEVKLKNKNGKIKPEKANEQNTAEILTDTKIDDKQAKSENEATGESKVYKNKSDKSRKRRDVQSLIDADSNEDQNETTLKGKPKYENNKSGKSKKHRRAENMTVDVQSEPEAIVEGKTEDSKNKSKKSRKSRDVQNLSDAHGNDLQNDVQYENEEGQTDQENFIINEGKDNIKIRKPRDAVCPCTRELNQVCGTNGVTYSNPCLLRCAAKTNKKIQLKFQGPCKGSRFQGKVRKTRDLKKPCICDKESEPLCSIYNKKCKRI